MGEVGNGKNTGKGEGARYARNRRRKQRKKNEMNDLWEFP
jgi:hypothetical protein